MTTQQRVFAPEFKRETVALLESSGRPLSHIAAEIGIMPSMLRAWPRSIQSGALSAAVASMSKMACCYDNAPMESFFHSFKVELVHQHKWKTREEAKRNLFQYIEGYYNRMRIHSALGYKTPERTELSMA